MTMDKGWLSVAAPPAWSSIPWVGLLGRSWGHGRVEQPRAAAPHRPGGQPGVLPRHAGLAIYREFGSGPERGTVFFLGGGFLELSGRAAAPPASGMALWLQVRELAGVRQELGERGVPILREPKREAWGLLEMWIADPDGVRICIVEVPEEHPLRRRD
jgi:Glyoxalase/Bleomycin resistance protein/Dioxygenase superfamily